MNREGGYNLYPGGGHIGGQKAEKLLLGNIRPEIYGKDIRQLFGQSKTNVRENLMNSLNSIPYENEVNRIKKSQIWNPYNPKYGSGYFFADLVHDVVNETIVNYFEKLGVQSKLGYYTAISPFHVENGEDARMSRTVLDLIYKIDAFFELELKDLETEETSSQIFAFDLKNRPLNDEEIAHNKGHRSSSNRYNDLFFEVDATKMNVDKREYGSKVTELAKATYLTLKQRGLNWKADIDKQTK